MTRYGTLLAGCAVLAMSTAAAYADCADELAMLESGEGISKDGSLAPLETEADAGADPGAAATGAADSTMAEGSTGADATTGAAPDSSMAADTTGAGATTGAAADSTMAADGSAAEEGVSKDGSLAPLETEAAEGGAGEGFEPATTGGDSPGVAMSQQDAEAQQEGDDTAAMTATDSAGMGEDSAMRTAALERAQTALAAGDEAGCMAAVEEARGL